MSNRAPSYDPCLNCRLPECDERSPRCRMRQGHALRARLIRRGKVIPDAVKQAYLAYNYSRREEARAQRSEARS